MNVVAFYRILYGQDFLADSLLSVLAHPAIRQVVLFMADRPFGGAEHVDYFGHRIQFPESIDAVRRVASEVRSPPGQRLLRPVEIVPNPWGTILPGQGRMMLQWIKDHYRYATHAMMVEPDEVWRPDCLGKLLGHAAANPGQIEYAAQVRLYWRSPRFLTRRTEPITVLRSLTVPVQDTGFHLSSGMPVTPAPDVEVHNYGYASSARTVFWKHLCALSFSRDKGMDSAPREDWFERDWLPWNFNTNRHGRLCPSINAEGHWPVPVIDEQRQPELSPTLQEWKACQ